MNDQLNNNTKPKNTKELFNIFLKITEKLYNIVAPNSVKFRKNKDKAKMKDEEIIALYLTIRCSGNSLKKGYAYMKSNFPNLVNYVERSRFNRLINSLMTVIRAIRKHFVKFQHSMIKIVDSFPLTVCKFGRAFFGKLFRDIASYGYCASKKEKYYGFKVHVVTDLNGNPYDYILTAANVDDRAALFELSKLVDIDILFADKGYDGKQFLEELFSETKITLIALQKKNSKTPLPKELRNYVSHFRRRIETTFNQMIEHFDSERVRSKSLVGLQTNLEANLFTFNLLTYINNGNTRISDVINFN